MATIIKRKKKFSVVYTYQNENGEKKQKWETFGNHKEALKRKNEVEYQQQTNTFKPPSKTVYTISELLYDFVLLYGKNNWALSTYRVNKSLIDNYINPKIGDLAITTVTARTIEEFYNVLKVTPAVARNGHKDKHMVTPTTIHEIHKVLRCAFNQAVKWEMLDRNPVEKASKPKFQYKKREIWTVANIKKALLNCDDVKLALAIQLAFVCTMRIGEITGLQWNNVDISDEAIKNQKACIYVKQELTRVSREAMEALNSKDVMFIFPALKSDCSTQLVLKTPKTESSVRKIFLPDELAYILKNWKREQAEIKEALQQDYTDYNLVVTLPNGRPVEHRIMDKALRQLEEKEKLPVVVFHSLRHSSATYKLMFYGSLKDLQNDGGWATIEMITKVYAHSIEEERQNNAQKFNKAFYGDEGFDSKKEKVPQTVSSEVQTNIEPENPQMDAAKIIALMKANPALAKEVQLAMPPTD